MQQLTIRKIICDKTISQKQADALIEANGLLQEVNHLNWKDFPYKPDVKLRIAHTGNEIWLKFYIQEKYIMAQETSTNGDVYKDSTVEFFISTDGKNYYNFEFSCIGTIHLAYGAQRENRKHIAPEIAEQIQIHSSLGNQPFNEKKGDFKWDMLIRIPKECFIFGQPTTFEGLEASANFYKCGDGTSAPHYISWRPIKSENPDYHRPEFFDNIVFE